MSNLYSILSERINDPRIKTSELSTLSSTAEAIAINLFKLESASFSALKQSNLLENQINMQLPSKSKYKELPKIIYNRESEDLVDNNINKNKDNGFIYSDWP